MNREILFRGKLSDNGEWVYGYYLYDPETSLMKSVIYSERKFVKVIPETVGQFTGLMDKNGTKIFEGDHFGNEDFPVYFDKGLFLIGGIPLKGYFNGEYMTQLSIIKGNIHDNPTT